MRGGRRWHWYRGVRCRRWRRNAIRLGGMRRRCGMNRRITGRRKVIDRHRRWPIVHLCRIIRRDRALWRGVLLSRRWPITADRRS